MDKRSRQLQKTGFSDLVYTVWPVLFLYRLDGIFGFVNEPTSKRSSVTRDLILEAASLLVQEQGASALTLDATCAKAGMSKGGLLYHFRSKDELMLALLDYQHRVMETMVQKAFDSDDAPDRPGRYHRALVRAMFQLLGSENPTQFSIVGGIAIQLMATGGQCHQALQQHICCKMEDWSGKMNEDGLSPLSGWLIHCTINGIITHQVMHQKLPDRAVLDQMRAHLISLATPQIDVHPTHNPRETE